jgi:hypothetical protein
MEKSMNIANDAIYNALTALGLNVRQTAEVTPEKQIDYMLVSVSELPSLEGKPTVSVNDSD